MKQQTEGTGACSAYYCDFSCARSSSSSCHCVGGGGVLDFYPHSLVLFVQLVKKKRDT